VSSQKSGATAKKSLQNVLYRCKVEKERIEAG
jgi:hypothetical protein